MTRNEEIIAGLALGQSYGQIAEDLGISRNVVAGVAWRAKIKVGPRVIPERTSEGQRRSWARMTPADRERRLRQTVHKRWQTNTPAEA
jgi:FixJ family two-component response regulator